jgi:hypothetical protein
LNKAVDHRITGRYRFTLAATGLMSWAAGGVASFVSSNGAGAAALVAAGGLSGVLGLMGRWPSRIAMSGNEVSWDIIDQTVTSQIQVAERIDEGETVLAELVNLRERLSVLQRTGAVPEHPAEVYDRAVMAAIVRLLPGAEVGQEGLRTRAVPDLVVRYRDSKVLAETKWRSDPTRPFGGSTLPQLIKGLPPEAKLLVITNTVVPPLPRAHQIVQDAMGGRGRIVRWVDFRDDNSLAEALALMLTT